MNPFTEEHQLLRQSVRSFLESEVKPHVDQWEKDHHCPPEVFRRMGELGFFGVSFPEDVGGSGMDMWSAVIIVDELSRMNAGGLSMSLYAHAYLPLPLINAIGTEEQKKKYLEPALKGEKIAALGITEPGAGSDVGGIVTTAEDKGDHYLVNGSKVWITNGTMADFIVLVVRTGEGRKLSLLIFDTNVEGFTANQIHDKMGMHSSDTGELFFDNCRVPKENLLGNEHMGFYYLMNNLQEERLLAGVTGVFVSEWALKKTKEYVGQREAFGRNLAHLQVVRHKIAQMAIKLEACRSFAFRAVQEFIEYGPKATKIISMAKAYTSEVTLEILHDAIQLHGGNGYMEEYGVARAYRDARLFTIGAGTTQIMHEIISKMELDEVHHQKQFIESRK